MARPKNNDLDLAIETLWRENRHLSQGQIARKLGVTPNTVTGRLYRMGLNEDTRNDEMQQEDNATQRAEHHYLLAKRRRLLAIIERVQAQLAEVDADIASGLSQTSAK